MATGNEQRRKPARRGHTQGDGSQQELAHGEAIVGTGRISAARRITPVLPTLPFSMSQLATLDDELARASRIAGLHFSVYLGDLGSDTHARVSELHDSMGHRADDVVLVAVSPGQRVVEVVTGRKAHHRLPDRGCKVAVESMISSFKEGDLVGGLTSGLRILAEQTDS
ncbi:MAG TPA: DUF5130 family protein [Pseudonocardiaceae bacterium]|nr:DUF5130 family protein [Pseudonocardiaceae bacterium]